MRTSKLLGFVCAGFVALAMSAPHAGASTLTPTGSLGPPKLQPNESPTVEQKNINVPLSILSLYNNNGDVHQSNNLGPSSGGDKGPKPDGNQYGSVEKDHPCNCDQSYGPKQDGYKDGGGKNRGDKDRGDKNRGNKDGNNCGCDQHRQKHKGDKDHRNKDRGDKYQGNQGGNSCGCNSPAPKPQDNYGRDKYQGNQGGTSCGCNYPAPKPESDYGQNKYQSNQGGTSCGCDYQGGQGYEPGNNQGDHPEVKQVNVNAPISILSIDSNNGDVRQSNDDSSSSWSNGGTEQKNVNVPISILSAGANNGDVHQSNDIGSSSKPDCGCNQKGYGSDGGSQDGGSYGGGNGNPMPPTGGIPVVGGLLGGSSGGGSLLGL